MPLSADVLIDRNRLKTALTRWRLLGIGLLVILLAVLLGDHGGVNTKRDHIARLNVEGIIIDDLDRDEALAEARDNKHIKAIIVRIDSPGGTVTGGEQLYRQLREISAVKPVVAVMRTMATSAAYMTAIGTDHIIAQEGTLTGSIGVIFQSVEISTLTDKLGITPVTIKSAPLKGSPSMMEKTTPEAQAAMQAVVMDMYAMFTDMVIERRQLPKETVISLADGKVYTGRQALQLKLIDQIGGEAEAVAWLAEQRKISTDLDVLDLEIHAPKTEWWEMVDSLAGKFQQAKALTTQNGLMSVWHLGVLSQP